MTPAREMHFDQSVMRHLRSDFVRVKLNESVGEALARVQGSQVEGRIVYFYAVDQDDRLCGVVPTRRLLLSPPETRVAEIMVRKVISLPSTATLLDACEIFTVHRLLALPVVDADRRMLGVVDVEVYVEAYTDIAERRESESVFQLIGVRMAQLRMASIPTAFRARFPWLLCNIAGGLACAFLASQYERVLANAVVLAMFIPIVLALAESVSIQSLTLTLQAHQVGRIRRNDFVAAFRREATIGTLLGACCGLVVGLVAGVWQGHDLVGLCILPSMTLAVVAGALFGLTVPMVLRALEKDPKTASGPIVLAMTDVTALFSYLGLASVILG